MAILCARVVFPLCLRPVIQYTILDLHRTGPELLEPVILELNIALVAQSHLGTLPEFELYCEVFIEYVPDGVIT